MLIAGLDDAGRGSVIGPLVIAGVCMNEQDLYKLTEKEVKDSKLLTARKRESLSAEIRPIAESYHVIALEPKQIDEVVLRGRRLRRLNWLEAETMAKVIQVLKPEKAYVDASDVLEDRFKKDILDCLDFEIELVSEHKADRTYPLVSAASIIAKVERDKAIEELSKTYGDIGSGYPSDPQTISFLERCCSDETGEYPDFVRRSWRPAQRIKEKKLSNQTQLI